MGNQQELLFLLEFLVDSLQLAPQCECASPPGETCVSFTFLDYAPLLICEEDFIPAMKHGKDNARLKSGKSCLFSLTSEQVSSLSSEFDVNVAVMKKMPTGWLPSEIQVGGSIISISNLFSELIENSQRSPDPESPVSKTLKDVFEILNSQSTPVGKIGVYIRMSCFGTLIVTQFQMNFDDKSVLFKDKEGKSLYRYKKAPKGKENKIDDMGSFECDMDCPFAHHDEDPLEPSTEEGCRPDCPGLPSEEPTCPMLNQADPVTYCTIGTTPCMDCSGKRDAPCLTGPDLMGMPYQQPGMMMQPGMCLPPGMGMPMGPGMGFPNLMTPCFECGMLPDPPCNIGYGGMQQGPMGGAPPYAPMAPSEPPGNYQEISSTLGTNTLTIRVHKKNKIDPIDGTQINDTTPKNSGKNTDNQVSGGDSCTCCPGAAAERKRNMGPQQSMPAPPQMHTNAYNMGLGVPYGDSRVPFSVKMGCSGQGVNAVPGKNVVVQPPTSVAADGTQFTEISDPDKDLFILRIGKKSEGIDKKNNLELELCTPRAPDHKPMPKHETRDTQFDPKDLPGGGKAGKGKGGKGKGKGGGGGGGKKGKKK